ncbi:hypothetical protein FNV43_RR10813 [Rhamnella rubrinervis]|uniref:Transmembrane protein n=1 Tax=Rhamnella rubrinervis TaxID=2594499 RepID=A0A8K0H4H3_9ROSA|nr:hypothetical protein FNV43_RR10813 [Rhamnella rubrinervis]
MRFAASHSSHTVTGHPIETGKQPLLVRHTQSEQNVSTDCDCDCCCKSLLCRSILLVVVVILFLFSTSYCAIVFLGYLPRFPSISLASATVPDLNVSSDTQITANLELLFDPVVNNNVDRATSIRYERVKAMVFGGRTHVYEENLLESTTVASFEQRAATITGRYGVSYLVIELTGFARMKGGTWWKRTSSMSVSCGVMKVVFPLNQATATTLALPDCQPPPVATYWLKTFRGWRRFDHGDSCPCEVDGGWSRLQGFGEPSLVIAVFCVAVTLLFLVASQRGRNKGIIV